MLTALLHRRMFGSRNWFEALWTEASSHVRGSAADLKNLLQNGIQD